MRFEIVTIFPSFFTGIFENGILRRALAEELVSVGVHDLRAFTHDRHRTVDDRPFGGGEGMVLKPEPLFEAVESLLGEDFHHEGLDQGENNSDLEIVGARFTENVLRERHAVPLQDETTPGSSKVADANGTAIVLLSASGKLFRQDTAR